MRAAIVQFEDIAMASGRKTKHPAAKRPARSARRNGAHKPAELSEHPVWQGNLRLSLVSCPVALFNATSRMNDISFHMLNPETNNRIRMIPTDPETGPVERAELVRGYEIEKDRYVVVTNEELDAVRLETTRAIEIERFVAAGDIDRLFWHDPYYLLPDAKEGVDAYLVIRKALEDTRQIALGRVVMHTRERLVAVEPRGKGLIAWTLRMRNEVIDPARAFADVPDTKPDRRMVEIAEKIIEQKEGEFEPGTFEDRYENALRDLIRRKEKGERLVTAPPPEESNVIDLMEALRRSLKGKGGAARSAHAKRRHAR